MQWISVVYIGVVTHFRGPVIPIVIQYYSSPSLAFIACKWSSMMASGRQQMSMEDIEWMEANAEEQWYPLEVTVRANEVCWRLASPTIDFH